MELSVLSHACLYVRSGDSSLVVDPWLLGSCYWRSWWNFPQAEIDPDALSRVDAVLISHIHWDHWHGPTLKKFFKGKPVLIPDEPGERSERDLRTIGFSDVRRLPHGKTVQIGRFKVTMYQFGLFLNDAAIVIEADGVTVLDANDAKIAGPSLRHVLARHGRPTFALRSHSSANPRVCFNREDIEDYVADDREHYFRAFSAFMDCVNPQYAVPFASNHCHLHDDVFALNNVISNPIQLRTYVQRLDRKGPWNLQVMLPGSTWSPEGGFRLRSEDCFENLDATLAEYREAAGKTLASYRRQEEAVSVTPALIDRFARLVTVRPRPRRLRGPVRFTLRWPQGRAETFEIDLASGRHQMVELTEHSTPGVPLVLMPAIVFRDATLKNMFHHAGISKRCRFLASSDADMRRLHALNSVLEKAELGLLPLSSRYVLRLLGAYVRRWRELFVYAQALWLLKVRRKPLYLAEEAILRGEM